MGKERRFLKLTFASVDVLVCRIHFTLFRNSNNNKAYIFVSLGIYFTAYVSSYHANTSSKLRWEDMYSSMDF